MNQIATTTYRRANGSNIIIYRQRVQRAPKVFPRAHTPSPMARRAANAKRLMDSWVEDAKRFHADQESRNQRRGRNW